MYMQLETKTWQKKRRGNFASPIGALLTADSPRDLAPADPEPEKMSLDWLGGSLQRVRPMHLPTRVGKRGVYSRTGDNFILGNLDPTCLVSLSVEPRERREVEGQRGEVRRGREKITLEFYYRWRQQLRVSSCLLSSKWGRIELTAAKTYVWWVCGICERRTE